MARHLTSATEDYLEAILDLTQEKGFARVRDIAERLEVGRSAVSNALHALARSGLVDYEPYRMVSLTDKGRQVAMAVRQRHAELKAFVTDVLGLHDKVADEAACRMEHSVNQEVVRRISYLGEFIRVNHGRDAMPWRKRFVDFCTQRDKAARAARNGHQPGKRNTKHMDQNTALTLADIRPGSTVNIVRIGGAARAKRRLVDMGLTRNAIVSVVRVAPLGDPIEINVRGYNLSLRKEQAQAIEVQEL